MNDVALFINLAERERFGETWKMVTYTAEGEDGPFHEVPYFVHRHYGTELDRAVRAGLDKGYAFGSAVGDAGEEQ